MIHFLCSGETFKPTEYSEVRWLNKVSDFKTAQFYWGQFGLNLKREDWQEAHESYAYQYAGILQNESLISIAAVWKFSNTAWDVSAVSTLEAYRRKGFSKKVISFLSAYILAQGRAATCSTHEDNTAMIATAKSIGFQVVPEKEVWWEFPVYS